MIRIYSNIIKHSPLQCVLLRVLNVDREADTDLELVTINEMDMITVPPASSSHSLTRLLIRFHKSEHPTSLSDKEFSSFNLPESEGDVGRMINVFNLYT